MDGHKVVHTLEVLSPPKGRCALCSGLAPWPPFSRPTPPLPSTLSLASLLPLGVGELLLQEAEVVLPLSYSSGTLLGCP